MTFEQLASCNNDEAILSILLVLSGALIGIYIAGSVGLVYYHLKG